MKKKTPFLQTDHLKYAYRTLQPEWILKNINLNIRSDEYLLISGRSGSGKSTLCRAFNGLIPHFYKGKMEGRVRVDGKETRQLSVGDLITQVGMVFQNPEAQLFNRTVESEIAFGLESLGLPRKEIRRRIDETFEQMGIAGLAMKNPQELSGGEQQLVCIAAVIAMHPSMLVLDEPYANLDPAHVHRVRNLLRSVHHQGMGIIISEHRLAPTLPDAGRMVLVNKGEIVLDGPPSSVLAEGVEKFGMSAPVSPEKWGDHASPVFKSRPVEKTVPLLSVEKISYRLNPQPILNEINFSLSKGECIALMGANGAGKTTLLKHLNGLLRPSEGQIFFRGEDIRRMKTSQAARNVGMAFQNPDSQFFKLSVREEVEAGPRALGCLDDQWIDSLISLFRLEHLEKRPPYRLSGGEKKRTAFAAALAARPAILVMDEPTSGQDAHFKEALGRFLADIRRKGQAVIFVTHDLHFAWLHAHRWLVMAEGRIIADDRPDRITADSSIMKCAGLSVNGPIDSPDKNEKSPSFEKAGNA